MKRILLQVLVICLLPFFSISQEVRELKEEIANLKRDNVSLSHKLDALQKTVDDVLWFQRLSDVAFVDKVFIYGPPPARIKNPTAAGANNPLKFWNYVFIPKGIDMSKSHPLIVLVHGGVHDNFSTYHTHIIKELLAQGYIVSAPEYRGSTGYGKSFWEHIDYGGLEVEDAHASRNFMVDNYEFVDKDRVALVGWSHGGLISLMAAFDHPKDYKCVFAGVPVSDLIARMGYSTNDYRELFSAEYHIGKTAREDIAEYRRRSPAWNAHKLQVPLLIHTNTNDDDVYVLEVEHLIKSLKAEGKKFDYEIFQDEPGGHSFDRIDTKRAKEIRLKIHLFLAKHLSPTKPIRSISDMNRSAYR